MKQLSKQLLVQITERLRKSLDPQSIYLFGSHAAGCADKDSDIDLLIVVADTTTNSRELAYHGRNSLWGIKAPFDLIVCTKSELQKWSSVSCNPIHTAVTKGRLIYESQN
jgi:uncharacterized protein